MSNDRRGPWRAVAEVIERAPLGSDEKLRLQHYTLLLGLGVPSMTAFAVVIALRGEAVLGLAILAVVSALVAGWFLIRNGVNALVVYRANCVVFGGLLLALAVIGGREGSKILWFYTFPLIAFFLMGKREGLVWVLAAFAGLGVVLLEILPGVEVYAYTPEFRVRFLVTFFIVAAIAYGFEHFREQFRLGMERERQRLQAALDEVQLLSGLVPICASCKKIRDDRGFWNQIETYLHDRSEMRFSHGICPDCARKLYPDLESADQPAPPAGD